MLSWRAAEAHSYRAPASTATSLTDPGGHIGPDQLGYPLSLRVQICRAHVPTRVSQQWVSPHDASLPSFGSWRAQFPALIDTMKALRLPTRVSVVTYLFRFHCPRLPPSSCSPRRSRKLGGFLAGPGLDAGCPSFRFFFTWTRMGSLRSSGDPSDAFAPFRDPGRAEMSSPLTGTSVLPSLPTQRRPRRYLFRG